MGHSSTSVTAVSFWKAKLAIKATVYNNQLGGRDLDELLVTHFVEEFKTKYKFDLSKFPKPLLRLRMAIEKLKKVLSTNSQAPLNIEALHDDKDVSSMITRADFENYAKPFFGKIGPLIAQVLEKAGWSKEQVEVVEMVGGSSRVPAVREAIKEFFGRELFTFTTNPDEAVARGCALMCAILSPAFKVREFEFKDIASQAYKICWTQDVEKSMVAFNTSSVVPSTKILSFVMRQPSLDFEVVLEPEHQFVGRFTIKNIPSIDQTGGAPVPVKVKVRLNPNQMFQVESAHAVMESEVDSTEESAQDATMSSETSEKTNDATPTSESTGQEPNEMPQKKVVVKKIDLPVVHGDLGLPYDIIQKLREEEISMVNNDRLVFDTEFAKNALEEYIYDARAKKDTDWVDFLESAKNALLTDLINTAEDWLYSDEGEQATKSVYVEKLKQMKEIGQPAEEKLAEFQARPYAVKNFMSMVQTYLEKIDDPEFGWLGEELVTLKRKLTEKSQWLQTALQQQNELAKHLPLIFKVAQVDKEREALYQQAVSVFSKPKPEPPSPVPTDNVKETNPPNASDSKDDLQNAAAAAASGSSSPPPMDTDSEDYTKVDA
ncbi:adenyl-nucleotide exchange factor sse1 [Coelomomyces lativittatus]|nr:adenyl-nucleotide exchange factor sse1 [Coelomomyces lativittatus]